MRQRRSGSLALLALPLTLALALGACSKPPPSSAELLADAQHYQLQGNTSAAIIQLRNLLDREPRHAQARYLLGSIYRQMNAPHAAEKEFRMALAAGYDPKIVRPLLAEMLFKQGQFEKLLDETRSSDHGAAVLTAPVLALRGHALASLGKRDDAAAAFAAALQREPGNADALLGQARLALGNNQQAQATALIQRATSGNPNNLDALLMQADLDRAQGRDAAALTNYRKGYALAPYNVPVNLNLATMLLQQGDHQQARKHVEALLKVAPENPMGYYLQALLEYTRHDIQASDNALQKALKANPNHAPANALAGLLAQAKGNDVNAEKQLRAALDKQPDNAYLRKMLAAALIRSNQAQAGIDTLEPLLQSHAVDAFTLGLLGEAYRQKQDLGKARQYFEQALARAPGNPNVRTSLGLTQLLAGDANRALAELEGIAASHNRQADELLASSLLAARQYDKALRLITQLEQTPPPKAFTQNLKGSVMLAKGELAAARTAFQRALQLQPGYLPAAMNLAQLDMRSGKTDLARENLQQVLKYDPKDVDAVLALADLENTVGNLAGAQRWLEKASQLQPASFKPLYAQARITFGRSEFAEAIPLLKNALKLQPEHAEALNMLAYAHLQLGQYPEASSAYSRLKALYPTSPQAHFGFSLLQQATGNAAGAELALKQALALDPDFPEALQTLAALQLKQKRVNETLQLANQVQKRQPRQALGYLLEGDARMIAKAYPQASNAYDKAYLYHPDSIALIKLQSAMRMSGKIAQADTRLADWLQNHPDDILARLNAADAALKVGQFKLAAEHYQQVWARQPNNIGVMHNLIHSYLQAGDPRALTIAEQAYRQNRDNPVLQRDLATLLLAKGDYERGLELLRQVLISTPDSAALHFQLAKAYLQAGKKPEARQELERVINSPDKSFDDRSEAASLLKILQN